MLECFRSATAHELRLIISLALIHGLNSVFINALPFWFKSPSLPHSFCSSSSNSTSSPSSSSSLLPLFSSSPDYYHSISVEYELYCSRLLIKPLIISILLFSIFIFLLLGFLFRTSPSKRRLLIFLTNLIAALLSIFSAFLTPLFLIVICLAGAVSMNVVYYINIYTFVAEEFEKRPFKSLLPAIMTMSWGVFGMGFAGWVWEVREWRSLNLWFCGGPLLIVSLAFYLITKENEDKGIKKLEEIEMQERMVINKNEETEEKSEKTIKNENVLRKILDNPIILANTIIFCLYWHATALVYIGITLAMETFEGSIYLTMFLFGLLETLASFLAGLLISKFDLKDLLILIGGICSFGLILQLFLSSFWTVTFAVISKANMEIMWTLLLTILMKIVPTDCHQFVFALSMVFSRFILIGLDFYNEGMKSFGISPLVGFGISMLIPVVCTFKMKYLEEIKA